MTERPQVTCRETSWLVSDARDRPLLESEKEALAEHIAGCSLCQGASEQFAVLFRQIGVYFKGEAPDSKI